MCVIVVNTIVIALNSPLIPEESTMKKAVHKLELLFTAIYGVEILIKTIACGLFCVGGYFRDPKNLADFFLFGLNIFSFLVTANLAILNALRAFHILILSKHFESLKIILVSLYKSLPYISKLFFFAFCFTLLFCKLPCNKSSSQQTHSYLLASCASSADAKRKDVLLFNGRQSRPCLSGNEVGLL